MEDPDEAPGCAKIGDCDDDGLPDGDEPEGCGTDPDCDDDGLLDGEEETGCVQDADCDNDNLPDGSEPSGCILFPDCDGDELLDGFELSRCIFDPDCDDDGLLDGEEEPSCITLNDCDDDGLPDGQEPEGCVLNPDCDGGGLLDGEEPEGCVLDPECGETIEEPVNTTEEEVAPTPEDPTPTPEDPTPTPEDPTPEPTPVTEEDKPEVVTLVAEIPNTGTFAIATFVCGLGAGIILFLLMLLLLLKRSRTRLISICLYSESPNQDLTVFARAKIQPGVTARDQIFSVESISEDRLHDHENMSKRGGFQISYTNEEPSVLAFSLQRAEREEEEPFVFMTSALPPDSQEHAHELQVQQKPKSGREITTPAIARGRTIGISWGSPSAQRSLKSYRLEGLTLSDGWRTITEFSPNQIDESKPLLAIDNYSHVRLRASFKWITGLPSAAAPVGDIEFIRVQETP